MIIPELTLQDALKVKEGDVLPLNFKRLDCDADVFTSRLFFCHQLGLRSLGSEGVIAEVNYFQKGKRIYSSAGADSVGFVISGASRPINHTYFLNIENPPVL